MLRNFDLFFTWSQLVRKPGSIFIRTCIYIYIFKVILIERDIVTINRYSMYALQLIFNYTFTCRCNKISLRLMSFYQILFERL